MRNECLVDGILQSYLDGELSSTMARAAAGHIASCPKCAKALETASAESLMFSDALAPEFSLSIPTERLRVRLDSEINRLHSGTEGKGAYSFAAVAEWLRSMSGLMSLTPQRIAMAGGAIAIVIAVGILGLVKQVPRPNIADIPRAPVEGIHPPLVASNLPAPLPSAGLTQSEEKHPGTRRGTHMSRNFSSNGLGEVASRRTMKAPVSEETERLLPGEKSYLRAIAKLKGAIEDPGEPIMRPTLRFEYERNLAVVDKAIATSRLAAQRNPNDPAASEFMLYAYQSKVDLLNTVAEQARFSTSGR